MLSDDPYPGSLILIVWGRSPLEQTHLGTITQHGEIIRIIIRALVVSMDK